MRKVTQQIVHAFIHRQKRKIGNSETDGQTLWLFGHTIAQWRNSDLWITNAGWKTNTTKERLNGLPGVNIYQKSYVWYLNDKEWDGNWIRVSDGFQEGKVEKAEDNEQKSNLRTIAMVMAMGNLLAGDSQKAKNDWKARMLKAGLEGRGLIMPEDWDQLSEDTKEARLNRVIEQLKEVKLND